jgi:metal-responsive CopG/Arc/MetJ family transcriptional regulator
MPAGEGQELIGCYVRREILEAVDRQAKLLGISRSEYLRRALLHYLREAEEEAEKVGELLGRHKGEESK